MARASQIPPEGRPLAFLARFGVLLVLSYFALAARPVNDALVVPFTAGIARVCGGILGALGEPVAVDGTRIHSPTFAVEIENGCNGLETVLLFGCAVLAFPAPWKRRLAGLAAGLVAIEAFNLVRVVTPLLDRSAQAEPLRGFPHRGLADPGRPLRRSALSRLGGARAPGATASGAIACEGMMQRHSRFRPLRAAGRALAGFLLGLAFWLTFSGPYERLLAESAEILLRATERPPVTRLNARGGEILIERSDMAPGAPRPGLPAADLHFNLALLAALFALDPRPWRPKNVGSFFAACALLFAVHLAALVFQVRSVYATGLGDWSGRHYGALARNFWAAGFHFYQIAGRFAAPFAIWWLFRREGEGTETGGRRGK